MFILALASNTVFCNMSLSGSENWYKCSNTVFLINELLKKSKNIMQDLIK